MAARTPSIDDPRLQGTGDLENLFVARTGGGRLPWLPTARGHALQLLPWQPPALPGRPRALAAYAMPAARMTTGARAR